MPQLEFKHQFNYRPLFLGTGKQKALTPPLPVIEIALSYNNGFFEHVAVALRSKFGLIYLNPEV